MVGDGVSEIRALVRAIRENPALPTERPCGGDALRTVSLSHFTCFLYTVCFGVVRSLLSSYGTTNPMWIKISRTARNRISPEWNTVRVVAPGLVQRTASIHALGLVYRVWSEWAVGRQAGEPPCDGRSVVATMRVVEPETRAVLVGVNLRRRGSAVLVPGFRLPFGISPVGRWGSPQIYPACGATARALSSY